MRSDLRLLPKSGVMVSPSARRFILNVKKKELLDGITGSIRDARLKPHDQGVLVSVPMHEDAVVILHNLGCNTSDMGPLSFLYEPPLIEGEHIPMPHQLEAAAFKATHSRSYDLSTMRTGKTGSEVMALDYLSRVRDIHGMTLVVAPLSTLYTVWKDTIEKTFPDARVTVLHGGTGKKDRLEKLKRPADYLVINPDGLKMIEDALYALVAQGLLTKVVFDELTIFGNAKSGRWQAANNIVNGPVKCPWVHGLTGTPGGNPKAVFGMTKLVTPWTMPADRQSVWDEMCYVRWGLQVWQTKERPETQFLIQKVLRPAIRFDKKDIMNLPPIVTMGRDAELTKDQLKLCRQIINEMIALTDTGEVIEAVNKAAMLHKYFQCAQGMAIGDKGKLIPVDDASRVSVIQEIINEAEAKTVIFCCYTGVIDKLVESLQGKGLSVAKVDGSVTGKKRETIFRDFQNQPTPKVLVAHPETVAFGVELSAADTMIFNGPPRVGTFKVSQALERLSSLKQKAKQITIVNLAATAEERQAFQDIGAGISSSESVNNIFTSMTKQGKV